MKSVLFVILFALSVFAAEVADSSVVQMDSSIVQSDSSVVQTDSTMVQSDSTVVQTDSMAVQTDSSIVQTDSSAIDSNGTSSDDGEGAYANLPDSSIPEDYTLQPEAELPVAREPQKNIPLPRQTSYTAKGLSVGIAAGVYDPTVECDCMGIWQAQIEYFYTDWISGGGDVRFFGGDLDKSSMLMYQRYRLDVRFHKTWTNFDIYAEPVFGFETTSISEFRSQVKDDFESIVDDDTSSSADVSEKELTECEKMFSLDGFSVGVGGGFGWKPVRYFGLTGSAMFEYSFSKSALLSITSGLAINLQEFWPWGKNNLRSIWLSAEFGTQRYFNRGVGNWSLHGVLGIQLTI